MQKNRILGSLEAEGSIIDYSSSFSDIHSFTKLQASISGHAMEYLERRYKEIFYKSAEKLPPKDREKFVKDKFEKFHGHNSEQAAKDFNIFKAVKRQGENEQIFKDNFQKLTETLFYTFDLNDDDKANKLLSLYFYGTYPPSDKTSLYLELEEEYEEKIEIFKAALGEIHKHYKEFDLSIESYDQNHGWFTHQSLVDSKTVIELFRCIFLTRRSFFYVQILVNMMDINDYLHQVVSISENMKPTFKYNEDDFRKVLNKYVRALNNSYDFIEFDETIKPENGELLNDPKDEIKAQLAEIRLAIKDVSSIPAEIKKVSDSVSKLHQSISDANNVVEKDYFAEYFTKGRWDTLSKEKKKEFSYKHQAQFAQILMADIGASLISIFSSDDPEKATKKAAIKILNDLTPQIVGALSMALGGPVLGSLIQSFTGALFGEIFGNKAADPLQSLIKTRFDNLDNKVDEMRDILITGFTQVLNDTHLIINQQEDLKRLVIGLGETIKTETQDLKKFIETEHIFEKVRSSVSNIADSLADISNSYVYLMPVEGKPKPINAQFVNSDTLLKQINTLVRNLFSSSIDFSNNKLTSGTYNLNGSNLYRILDYYDDKDFLPAVERLLSVCSGMDQILSAYSQLRQTHVANNAIIALVHPELLSKVQRDDFMQSVLRDLFKMQQQNDEGFVSALASYGKLATSVAIGKGNLYLYSTFKNSALVTRDRYISMFNSVLFAELDNKFDVIVSKKSKHPLWISIDQERNDFSEDKSTQLTRFYVAQLGNDSNYTRFIYKNQENHNSVFECDLSTLSVHLNKNDSVNIRYKSAGLSLPKSNSVSSKVARCINIASDYPESAMALAPQIEHMLSEEVLKDGCTTQEFFYFDQKFALTRKGDEIQFGDMQAIHPTKEVYLDKKAITNKSSHWRIESTTQGMEFIKYVISNHDSIQDKTSPISLFDVEPFYNNGPNKVFECLRHNRVLNSFKVYSPNRKHILQYSLTSRESQFEEYTNYGITLDTYTLQSNGPKKVLNYNIVLKDAVGSSKLDTTDKASAGFYVKSKDRKIGFNYQELDEGEHPLEVPIEANFDYLHQNVVKLGLNDDGFVYYHNLNSRGEIEQGLLLGSYLTKGFTVRHGDLMPSSLAMNGKPKAEKFAFWMLSSDSMVSKIPVESGALISRDVYNSHLISSDTVLHISNDDLLVLSKGGRANEIKYKHHASNVKVSYLYVDGFGEFRAVEEDGTIHSPYSIR